MLMILLVLSVINNGLKYDLKLMYNWKKFKKQLLENYQKLGNSIKKKL